MVADLVSSSTDGRNVYVVESKQRSLRAAIREWWQEELSAHVDPYDEVNLADIAERAVMFVADDPELCKLVFLELVKPACYDIGMDVAYESRRKARDAVRRGVVQSGAQLADTIQRDAKSFESALVFDPKKRVYIKILNMTKEQALAAAEAREKMAVPHLEEAGFFRIAAGKCTAGQRLSDAWTVEGLMEVRANIEVARPQYSLGRGTLLELMQKHGVAKDG